MGDKLHTQLQAFDERLNAAGLAELGELDDARAVQVGMIFAETFGLTLGPDGHRVLGQASLHVRRSLARARGPAREEE
jgi:hypothetical protein